LDSLPPPKRPKSAKLKKSRKNRVVENGDILAMPPSDIPPPLPMDFNQRWCSSFCYLFFSYFFDTSAEVKELELKLSAKDNAIDQMKVQMEEFEIEVQDKRDTEIQLLNRIESLEREVRKLKEENKGATTRETELWVQVSNREEKIKELEKKNTELEEKVVSLEKKAESVGENTASIESLKVKHGEEKEAWKCELDKMKIEYREIKEKMEKLEEEKETWEKNLEQMNEENQTLQEKIYQLEEKETQPLEPTDHAPKTNENGFINNNTNSLPFIIRSTSAEEIPQGDNELETNLPSPPKTTKLPVFKKPLPINRTEQKKKASSNKSRPKSMFAGNIPLKRPNVAHLPSLRQEDMGKLLPPPPPLSPTSSSNISRSQSFIKMQNGAILQANSTIPETPKVKLRKTKSFANSRSRVRKDSKKKAKRKNSKKVDASEAPPPTLSTPDEFVTPLALNKNILKVQNSERVISHRSSESSGSDNSGEVASEVSGKNGKKGKKKKEKKEKKEKKGKKGKQEKKKVDKKAKRKASKTPLVPQKEVRLEENNVKEEKESNGSEKKEIESAPLSIKKVKRRVIAKYGSDASQSGDNVLNLSPDDVIVIVREDERGWAFGINEETKEKGWFPKTHVYELPLDDQGE